MTLSVILYSAIYHGNVITSRVRIEPDETVYRLLKLPSDSIYFLRLRWYVILSGLSYMPKLDEAFFYIHTSATLPISALGDPPSS